MTTTANVTTHEKPGRIPNGLWLASTLGLIMLVVVLHLVMAWRTDVYGVLRDTHGRSLIVSDHERRSKYLLNQAYVPQNFDALIIGASASLNWRTAELKGYRFYNESVDGSDGTEQRMFVEQALPSGHFKVALVVINPRITERHTLQDGLDQVSRNEAFGSISSVRLEFDYLLHHNRPTAGQLRYPDGSRDKDLHTQPKPTDTFEHSFPPLDEQSREDYKALVEELMARGVKIIYVTYPLYEPNRAVNQDVLTAYNNSFMKYMPAAPVIDFDAPEYASFREDPTNYVDKIHLSPDGSRKLGQILNGKMHQILRDQ